MLEVWRIYGEFLGLRSKNSHLPGIHKRYFLSRGVIRGIHERRSLDHSLDHRKLVLALGQHEGGGVFSLWKKHFMVNFLTWDQKIPIAKNCTQVLKFLWCWLIWEVENLWWISWPEIKKFPSPKNLFPEWSSPVFVRKIHFFNLCIDENWICPMYSLQN